MKTEMVAYLKGHRVDEFGNVLGLRIKYIKPNISKAGYLYFSPKRIDGSNRTFSVMVHRLAAYQWFGDKLYEPGIEVRHLDGNPLNNSKNNIVIGTKSQNAMDKLSIVRLKAAKVAAQKLRSLTDEEVKELRSDRDSGFSYKELMLKYNICKSTVSYIVNYKTYK